MHPFVYHNDRLLPLSEVRLSPGQAGLLHGWGVFTTMRVYDGAPFALDRHWNRLARDAEKIQLPLTHTQEAVGDALRELIAANRVHTGCIRIYFVLNKATLWHSDESMPRVDLIIYSIDLPTRVGPTQLTVMVNGRHAANPLTGTKVISWLNNVWHVERAHRQGFDDAILLNERGEVAECTASNVFCIQDGSVSTPPPSSGCLCGITREILLEIAPIGGIPIVERTLSVDELLDSEEVFISSTTRHVQPVARIDERRFSNTPGALIGRLTQMMSVYVSDSLRRQVAKA